MERARRLVIPARRQGVGGGKAALYICRNFSCQRPLTDPKEVTENSFGVATNGSDDPADTLNRSDAPWLGQSRGDSQYAARIVSQSRHDATELGMAGSATAG